MFADYAFSLTLQFSPAGMILEDLRGSLRLTCVQLGFYALTSRLSFLSCVNTNEC